MLFMNKAFFRAVRLCPPSRRGWLLEPRRLRHPGGVAGSTVGRTGPGGAAGLLQEAKEQPTDRESSGRGGGKCHAENNLQSRRCASVFPIAALWVCRFFCVCVCFLTLLFENTRLPLAEDGWMSG